MVYLRTLMRLLNKRNKKNNNNNCKVIKVLKHRVELSFRLKSNKRCNKYLILVNFKIILYKQ